MTLPTSRIFSPPFLRALLLQFRSQYCMKNGFALARFIPCSGVALRTVQYSTELLTNKHHTVSFLHLSTDSTGN